MRGSNGQVSEVTRDKEERRGTNVDLAVGGARVDVPLVRRRGRGEVAADQRAQDAVTAVGHHGDVVRVFEVLCV